MADGLKGVIAQLARQKTAIERALTALRQIEGIAAPGRAAQVVSPATLVVPTRKRRKFSAASRRKMALAQKARWAKINGEIEAPALPAPEPSKPKRHISAEGMKRIIAATKKRWRLHRAASAVKKTAYKYPAGE